MGQIEQIKREIAFQAAIQTQVDAVVKLATRTVSILTSTTKLEESQLRNLLNVATQEQSVAVTVNFVRYQIGREGGRWERELTGFGHTVIKDLQGRRVLNNQNDAAKLAELAQAVVNEFRLRLPAADVNGVEREAHVRLMHLYLGYLTRAFYYAKKTGDFAGLAEVDA